MLEAAFGCGSRFKSRLSILTSDVKHFQLHISLSVRVTFLLSNEYSNVLNIHIQLCVYLPPVWSPVLHKLCWHTCFVRLQTTLGGNRLVLPFVTVFPTGKAFIFRSLSVSPVFHFREGVWAPVCDSPAVLGPQGLSLGGLAGGGPLQTHRDSLGRTSHEGDGLNFLRRTCGRDTWELKHLVLIWRWKDRLWH